MGCIMGIVLASQPYVLVDASRLTAVPIYLVEDQYKITSSIKQLLMNYRWKLVS